MGWFDGYICTYNIGIVLMDVLEHIYICCGNTEIKKMLIEEELRNNYDDEDVSTQS
jgi:hypothetical protein